MKTVRLLSCWYPAIRVLTLSLQSRGAYAISVYSFLQHFQHLLYMVWLLHALYWQTYK